jgi:sarcosine oxidase, subunit alpha
MSAWRTAAGGRIDRSKSVSFCFDGRIFRGVAGDTLASALLANGVHLVGRSFKYHRPRGILAAGVEEPSALVTVSRDRARTTPNLRATQVELYEGLVATSQNRWPSLASDVGRINDWLSPFFPAGFYYKTFMWPKSAWKSLYEPVIRRAAGLGEAPTLPDPDRYAQRYAHCDVLVVGAGPAGLAAALAAAGAGARVILCDEQPQFGGSLLADTGATIDGRAGPDWAAGASAELAGHARVTLLPRTTAFGYFPAQPRRAQRAPDRPPCRAAERRRARAPVAGPGPQGRPCHRLDRAPARVSGQRSARNHAGRRGTDLPEPIRGARGPARAHRDLERRGLCRRTRSACRWRSDCRDRGSARGSVGPLDTGSAGGRHPGHRRRKCARHARRYAGIRCQAEHGAFDCDSVLMSGGFTPSVHLFSQSRGRLKWSEALQAFVPGQSAEAERSAGACRGIYALDEALADGAAAGADAADQCGARSAAARGAFAVTAAPIRYDAYLGALPGAAAPGRQKAFVDWQHDVTVRDLALASREGFRSIEHVKRYTTTGMATDQGKTSNLNAMSIVAASLGLPLEQVGLTTFRMPYTPTSFGSLAGASRADLFDPVRRTPTHGWAEAQGAVFENVSLWKRARYFPRAGEDMHASVARECRAVRAGVGLFDASTLGKIEVVGPGAAEFLNRLYVNNWSNLAVGRCRYGILCREDGFIYDDGVIARIANDRFHVTTTTGGAPRVLAMMEDYRQTEWPELEVWLTSTTEQWAVMAVQGPNARTVIERLVAGIDVSAAALPHMSVVEGIVCGVPARLFRVSFSGELGFEINVPADYGLAVWEAVHAAGADLGMVVYGTETMHVLRAEKGYIIVGQDTDGTMTPDDAGLSWAIGKAKADFVGKRSLARASMHAPDRKQLVGLRTKDPRIVLEEGAQVAEKAGLKAPMPLLGHVTSSYDSKVLGYPIALAAVCGGRARLGQTLFVPMPDGDIAVEVTSPVFYDPQGARING